MRRYCCRCLVVLAMLVAGAAGASYHTFVIEQLYSNADATVQFIVLHESLGEDGENFLRGHTLKSTHAGATQTYTFTRDLPGGGCVYSGYSSECTMSPTANSRVLIGTQGFAAISTVAPDYLIPNGFLSTGSGLVNYADVDFMSYGSLPTDGVSALNRNGTMIQNLATNFNGQSTSLSLAGPPSVFGNFQGLWWNDPDESESGWGINFNHQGSTIFATWFTFGLAGQPLWLVATLTSTPAAPNVFTGDLFTFSGSRFDAFDQTKVVSAPAGSATITFSDLNHATFNYTVGGASQVKPIKREPLNTSPVASCSWGAQPNLALATNYQDLWYAFPADSEKGWGINFTHQGNTIFATWFTYGLDGQPLWLVAAISNTPAQPSVYAGTLVKAVSGPPFNAVPFDTSMVNGTATGTLTVTFADGNRATFAYSVDGIAQSKQITRDVFAPPGTTCQ